MSKIRFETQGATAILTLDQVRGVSEALNPAVASVVSVFAGRIADTGRRVIMPDLRGHGASGKPHDPAAYPKGILGRDVKELVALAKAKPDSLNFAISGLGGANHLAGIEFALAQG